MYARPQRPASDLCGFAPSLVETDPRCYGR